MVELFLNNILPIFLVSGAGFLIGKLLHLQPRLLSQVTLYLFTPCLTFKLLTTNPLISKEILGIFLFAFTVFIIVGLITLIVAKWIKLEKTILASVLLCALFMNAGNFGIPLLGFSFGEKAQAFGSLYFVSMAVLTNTIGIAIASSGKSSLRQSLGYLIRFPALYAVGIAFVFIALGWSLPLPLTRSVDILSGAAIPCMLILLGMQLQTAKWNGHYKALGLAITMRMLVAPIIALGIAQIFGISGSFFQAMVTESSMPPAVMNALLATEYDAEPSFATFTILTGTLLSPFTLTPLISFLGA